MKKFITLMLVFLLAFGCVEAVGRMKFRRKRMAITRQKH